MFREPDKWKHFKKNKNLYLSFFVMTIGLVILLPLIIPKNFKYDMGLNDLIQAMGQFATAGAFIFAVFQFRYARERDRQAALCAEAKSMHERIRAEASSIGTIEGPWVYRFSNVFGRMSNVASFLRRVFDAIDEGVEKDILRMYWQETTYSGFIRPFQLIHIEEFIDWDRTPREVYDLALDQANTTLEAESRPLIHFLFYRALYIILHEGVHLEDDDSPMFMAVRDEVMRFKILFHDSENTLRYKSSNERPADMRVFAPAMAAIFVARHGYVGPWENSDTGQDE